MKLKTAKGGAEYSALNDFARYGVFMISWSFVRGHLFGLRNSLENLIFEMQVISNELFGSTENTLKHLQIATSTKLRLRP